MGMSWYPQKPLVFCIIKMKKTWRQITGPCSRMCEVISHLYLLNMSNVQDPCCTQWVDLREKFQSISSQSVQLSMAFNGHFRESTNMEDNRQFNWTGQQGIDNGVYFLWKLWIYVAISGTDLLEVPTILNINGHFRNRFIGGTYYILFGLCFRPILYKFKEYPQKILSKIWYYCTSMYWILKFPLASLSGPEFAFPCLINGWESMVCGRYNGID